MTNESVFSPERVTIVGVLNVTPDSFSDGGALLVGDRLDPDRLLAQARALVDGGADVLDVGGESTRPGSVDVPVDQEIERTEGAVALLVDALDTPVSIDTRKAAVAERAIAAGATLVNDVSGLAYDPALAEVVRKAGCLLILGHMRGEPRTMQHSPHYEEVLDEVAEELADRIAAARGAGIEGRHLVVDPGIGFGKRLEDNLALLAHCGWLRDRLGLPLLVGPSRKSFIQAVTGDPVGAREQATAAACAIAAFTGADAVRVHDPNACRRAVLMGRAVRGARRKGPR